MNETEYQLPEPSAMMSARTYKAKFVEPFVSKLKAKKSNALDTKNEQYLQSRAEVVYNDLIYS